MSSTIDHLRPLLRLAESAQQAQDDDLARAVLAAAEILARDNPPVNMAPVLEYMRALTSECSHCYMVRSKDELTALREKMAQELARHNVSLIERNDQKVLHLPPMVRLVTALYIRQEGRMTEGVSIAFTIDQAGVLEFPRKGPLIPELQRYCAEHQVVQDDINDYWPPEQLADYRLMVGSVSVQRILPEELQEMSW